MAGRSHGVRKGQKLTHASIQDLQNLGLPTHTVRMLAIRAEPSPLRPPTRGAEVVLELNVGSITLQEAHGDKYVIAFAASMHRGRHSDPCVLRLIGGWPAYDVSLRFGSEEEAHEFHRLVNTLVMSSLYASLAINAHSIRINAPHVDLSPVPPPAHKDGVYGTYVLTGCFRQRRKGKPAPDDEYHIQAAWVELLQDGRIFFMDHGGEKEFFFELTWPRLDRHGKGWKPEIYDHVVLMPGSAIVSFMPDDYEGVEDGCVWLAFKRQFEAKVWAKLGNAVQRQDRHAIAKLKRQLQEMQQPTEGKWELLPRCLRPARPCNNVEEPNLEGLANTRSFVQAGQAARADAASRDLSHWDQKYQQDDEVITKIVKELLEKQNQEIFKEGQNATGTMQILSKEAADALHMQQPASSSGTLQYTGPLASSSGTVQHSRAGRRR